jgi:hypothetical protein
LDVPMPLPPANLAQSCDVLPKPPQPLIDPERLQWEADLLYAYAACAARQRALAKAWADAVQAAEK